MSQENVEVVRRLNAAWTGRDVEAVLAECHPDVEVVLRDETYRGHDGVRRMAESAFATASEVWIDEVRDCDRSRVLLLGRQRGWVEGVSSESVVAEVFEIDAGRVRRCQAFPRIEQALEAAALRD
jgi:ketosteroid isomerase-like protein